VFALNIAIGNMSLRWVSVNFNQVARALVPAVVMLVSMAYFGKTYSSDRKWAVIPVVIGVGLTFYGGSLFINFYPFAPVNIETFLQICTIASLARSTLRSVWYWRP
jgi:hypothetical protein